MKKVIFGICCLVLLTNLGYGHDGDAVQVEVLAKTGTSWDESQLPAYPGGTPEVTILRIRVPPGVQLPMHRHPVINAGVLLTGELTVTTEDAKVLHLRAGDSIVELVNTWHYGRNDGKEMAEIIVFYAGIKDKPITVKNRAWKHFRSGRPTGALRLPVAVPDLR